MPRVGKVAVLAALVACTLLGACRRLAAYPNGAAGGSIDDGGIDSVRDARAGEATIVDLHHDPEGGPDDLRADVSIAHILFVDDDWVGRQDGDPVFAGGVFGDNAFASIGDALRAAEKDPAISEIEVRAGAYDEAVVIKTPNLFLRGVGRPIVRHVTNGVAEPDSVISINASGVTLQGFELAGGGNGITVNCVQTNVTIRDNDVHGMVNAGGSRGVGILVWGACSKVVIRENTVHENDRQGIYLGSTIPTVIASDNTIRDNVVTDNGLYTLGGLPGPDPYGIQVHFATRTEVRGNTISGQNRTYGVTPAGAGIWLTGQDNQVLDNDISGCLDGIWVGAAVSPQITGNTLHGNGRGLLFSDLWSGAPVATDNLFCGNSVGLRNNGLSQVDARRCWWGDPAGANQGGDKAVGLIDTTNPQTTPPAQGPCVN